MKSYMDEYSAWVEYPEMTSELANELASIKDDPAQIEDRFYSGLKFGTAGLRGVIGAGTNRMNVYVVRRASKALAKFILKTGGESAAKRGVAIAYDSRKKSSHFAMETALTLAEHGIVSYLYESLRSVPQLSFTVRHLNCVAGVVITASHNPPEYNGYKVYGEDGGQLPPGPCAEIMNEMDNISMFEVRPMDKSRAEAEGLLKIIGRDVDEAYYNAILSLRLHSEIAPSDMHSLKVVYTPLHGAGAQPVKNVLSAMGVDVVLVPEQEMPNDSFPTVKTPNPENPEAFELAEKLAGKVGASVMLATDPDSDRLGVGVLNSDGNYDLLTGNQIGSILTYFILSSLKEKGKLPQNGVVIKSIVSTRMADAICKSFGVKLEEVLTGFRFIAEKIDQHQKSGDRTFLFGFEESYGFLAGGFVRDKDAICASMLITECCAVLAQKGKTLNDLIRDLYDQYGCFRESTRSYTLAGKDGLERIAKTMESLRQNPPQKIAEFPVRIREDILDGTRVIENDNVNGQVKEKIDLPSSNVLRFLLDDEAWVCIRPSGTEPKLKLYAGARADTPDCADAKLKTLLDFMEARLSPTLKLGQ